MPIRISGSTGISGLDGSATTPVLQGASANSGIYYSGNTVFVSTSGTNALTIGPTGNVAFANSSVSIGGQTISAYSGMMKNRIINGDFRIDQRFNGAANNQLVGAQYVVDRWVYSTGGFPATRLRFQQNNTNGPGSSTTQNATGFPYYFGANVITANTTTNALDYAAIIQQIEGLNISDLGWGTSNASPITLSFWVYSSIAGTYGGSVRNSNNDYSYPFSYNISTANTWQYQTVTIPGETAGTWYYNNTIGLKLSFSLGVGTTYTSTANGAWQSGNYFNATGSVNIISAANGAFYLTGVQLEKGSQATPFEFRHYTTELQLCQRYFLKFNPPNGAYFYNITAGSYRRYSISYPVTMRIASDGYRLVGSIAGNTAAAAITSLTDSSMEIAGNATNASDLVYWNGGYVTVSAELGVQN